jgi:hypothetical protein
MKGLLKLFALAYSHEDLIAVGKRQCLTTGFAARLTRLSLFSHREE